MIRPWKRTVCAALFLFAVVSRTSVALPERVLSMDFGFGVPELVTGHVQVQVWKRWQFGFGYTYIPITDQMTELVQFPSQTYTLADAQDYRIDPVTTPSLSLITPFVRYFPADNNFYFQFAYTMLGMTLNVTTGLTHVLTDTELPGAAMNAVISWIQPLPSASIGYIFSGDLYYFNVTLGAVWVAPLLSSVTVATTLPDAVGGAAGNTAATESLQAELQSQSDGFSEQIRETAPFFPYIYIAFGFLF